MPKAYVEIDRDVLLMLIGWIQAHRPQGEWEPEFLGVAFLRMQGALKEGDGNAADQG